MSKKDKTGSLVAIAILTLVFWTPGFMMIAVPTKHFGMMVTQWYCDMYYVVNPMDVAWLVMGVIYTIMTAVICAHQTTEVICES
jgi:hypothetical protein